VDDKNQDIWLGLSLKDAFLGKEGNDEAFEWRYVKPSFE
jgi:hypothetical protein